MNKKPILRKAHFLNFAARRQRQHHSTYLPRQLSDGGMFTGTRAGQAIRTGTILVGFDMQLDVPTQ
ncbi:hypothetical protein XH81_30270 [Bradyrhizobium sp. CCBAU 25360]|nr:hypothetical protein [Bradyrhizobium sp. CCBAU 25360]